MENITSFNHKDIKGYQFGSSYFGPPRMFVYVYYIDGLLIDTGHPNMRKTIADTLKDLKVDQMLITHHHEDHSGNIKALQDQFQCPAFSSEACSQIMKDPPLISPAQYMTWGKYDAFDDLKGVGPILKTKNYSFEVIPIPGHVKDMIALYEPNEGWLFSADLYVYHRIRYFMRAESLAQQINSIKKILPLNFGMLFCSHNPRLDGQAKEVLKQKLQFFEDFYGSVSDLYHQGNSPRAIMKTLQIKEDWRVRLYSLGALSALNMVKSVIRDELHNS